MLIHRSPAGGCRTAVLPQTPTAALAVAATAAAGGRTGRADAVIASGGAGGVRPRSVSP